MLLYRVRHKKCFQGDTVHYNYVGYQHKVHSRDDIVTILDKDH